VNRETARFTGGRGCLTPRARRSPQNNESGAFRHGVHASTGSGIYRRALGRSRASARGLFVLPARDGREVDAPASTTVGRCFWSGCSARNVECCSHVFTPPTVPGLDGILSPRDGLGGCGWKCRRSSRVIVLALMRLSPPSAERGASIAIPGNKGRQGTRPLLQPLRPRHPAKKIANPT